jgi:GPH family glycoside/pentoside/hexuronide:cation symporter
MGAADQDRQASTTGPGDLPAPPSTPAPPPHVANPYTASTFQIHAWGSTAISYYFQYSLFALVGPIINLGFGMDPRIVAWALALPRVIDAFVDPLVGHLSDITRTRWGRRRPFMFACAILSALLGMALWRVEPDWHWFAQIAYLCVFVTMYFTVVMTFELTRNALSFELSDDYSIRSKIMAINNFWMTVPQLLGAGTWWFVLQLATGATWKAEVPAFHVGWAAGLGLWLGGTVALAALLTLGVLRGRPALARYLVGGGVLALLVVAPAACRAAKPFSAPAA